MTCILAPVISSSLPPLPFPLQSCVSLFFGLHIAWRWKTEALEIYRHRMSYLSGKCFRYLASYSPIPGEPIYPLVKVTLIGRRYLELQAQYEKTWECYKTAIKTALFQRSYDLNISWRNGIYTDEIFGAATNRWLHIQAAKVARTPFELIKIFLELIGNTFLLGHHAVLVLESLRWNADSDSTQALDKFFINAQVVLEHHREISKNQKTLVARLRKVQPFLSKNFLTEEMTQHLLFVIETLDRGSDRAQKIAEHVEDLSAIAHDSSQMALELTKEMGKTVANAGSQLFFGFPAYNDLTEFAPRATYHTKMFNSSDIRLKPKMAS